MVSMVVPISCLWCLYSVCGASSVYDAYCVYGAYGVCAVVSTVSVVSMVPTVSVVPTVSKVLCMIAYYQTIKLNIDMLFTL